MDKYIERQFVHFFVIKRKQERILFELNSIKHRSDCILAIITYHLDNRYSHTIKSLSSENEIYKHLKCLNFTDNCYVLAQSAEESICTTLANGISYISKYGGILYSPNNNRGFYIDEYYNKIVLIHRTDIQVP